MTNHHGDFIWYELMTSDADAAGEFYGKVVGWTSARSGQPGMDYRFFSSGDGSDMADGVGGYMAITPEMAAGGARPAWVSYIAVDDVDAACAQILAHGGAIHRPATDLEGVGRMAMVADPAGAVFYVMRGASDDQSHAFAKYAPKPGHAAWNELATSDPAGAWDFYGPLFGWKKGGTMDMGPMGEYVFIESDVGIGGVYTMLPEDPQPHWLCYFRVADIDGAVEAIAAHGGRLHQPPTPIPGGEFSLVAIDPQGAAFGLVGARQ
jgi:uncharacterized protein